MLNIQNLVTCIPVLTPQGPIQHLKVLMGRLNQIDCQSLTRRVLYHQQNWEVLTQDNWVLQTVQGYLIDFTHSPHQSCQPPPIILSQDKHALVTQEVQELLAKEAVVETISSPTSFISQIFLVEKKGGAAASGKPKGFKSIHPSGTFQNGGSTPLTRPITTRGLDGENGLKGCLPPNPNPLKPSTPSPVCLGGETLQVSVPPIWSVISTTGFHKTLETSSGPLETDRLTPDSVSGRPVAHAFEQGTAGGNSTTDMQPVRSLGTDGEYPKVPAIPNPTNRISGFSDQLLCDVDHSAIGEGQENTTGSNKAFKIPINVSKAAGYIYREGSSNLQSTSTSPVTLQSLAESTQFSHIREQFGVSGQVRLANSSQQRDYNRLALVGSLGRTNIGSTSITLSATSVGDRIRCLTSGVGSTVHGCQYRRQLVNSGSTKAYQLSGVAGCFPCSQNFCEYPKGCNPCEAGQHLSSNIYKSEGRYSFSTIIQSGTGNLGMVSTETDNHPSRTLTRSPQRCSGLRIQGDEGPVRLDDQPCGFSANTTIIRPPSNRPICLSTDTTVTPLLQLEAGSGSRGNRCLYSELGSGKGLCQPPLVPHFSVPKSDKMSTSQSTVSNTTLAIPTMVPTSSGDVGGLSSSTPSDSGHCSEPIQSGVHNEARGSSTGRMARLRDSFASRGISTQASELLLSSWRSKTNNSYNSLFSKWAGWCEQRNRDPTVGPVEDVVNFLAELHSKGYQYRSLNAYRSAISSIHQQVDGQNIGQHPLVSRVLKGAFNQNPPTPRYSHFWDVGLVLRFIRQLGNNNTLPLKWLSIKTAMLMALTRPSRSADLSKLDIKLRTYTSKGVIFQPSHLSKQSRSSKPVKEFFFPFYAPDEYLCPVRALQVYERNTASFRSGDSKSILFLSWIGKHEPVSSSSIARWLRICLQEAGVDTDTFKAHSVRGAACSTAAWSGVTVADILNAADWSNEGTFQQFYHREVQDTSTFGSSVLSAAKTSNLHVDMETEPSEM